jgi:hypothetical protein
MATTVTLDYATSALEPLLREFASLNLAQVASLPEVEERKLQGLPAGASLWVYREDEANGTIRVIAQLSVDHGRFLLVFRQGQVFVEGLEFSGTSDVRRLRQDELYEYN